MISPLGSQVKNTSRSTMEVCFPAGWADVCHSGAEMCHHSHSEMYGYSLSEQLSIIRSKDDHLGEAREDSLQNREQAERLAWLREEILRCERHWRPRQLRRPISSGCAELDAVLPYHGWCWGTLVEWLIPREACGVKWIALVTLRSLLEGGGMLVVIDPRRQFYPPAILAAGVPLESVVIIRPPNGREALWAVDQALQAGEGVVVWADVPACGTAGYRRFQLAVEQTGTLGFLFRWPEVRRRPIWADLRLRVYPRPTQGPEDQWPFRIEVLQARGRFVAPGSGVDLWWNGTTGRLCAFSPLASAATKVGAFARA
jgi:hypothetical protein